MARRALIGSIALYAFMVADLVWGNTLLPHAVELSLVVSIVIAWLWVVSSIARRENAPLRIKVIGWLLVFAFVGYTVIRTFSSYYLYHGSWSQWVMLGAVASFFFASAMIVAVLLLPRSPPSNSATPYTVESEAPDHVLHVGSTPNYSLKRTAGDRLGVD